jgi:hypothetical protein
MQKDRGAWPLIRQFSRQLIDLTLKPTAQGLLPRLIGFPLETRALLHDMWQLFLAVQLIPFPRLHLHVNSKAHSPPLGSWDEQDGGPWTVDRGSWMMMTHDFGDACSPTPVSTVGKPLGNQWAVGSGQWAQL